LQCIELAVENPSSAGEFRIFNQFTQQFSVNDLAEKVSAAARRASLPVTINNLPNPRVEQENHYYNAKHTKLIDLGLKPHLLTDAAVDSMLSAVRSKVAHVDASTIAPTIKWAQ
jgi:UDP-sulfoquinovose synthase